jgi:hypothetical protein
VYRQSGRLVDYQHVRIAVEYLQLAFFGRDTGGRGFHAENNVLSAFKFCLRAGADSIVNQKLSVAYGALDFSARYGVSGQRCGNKPVGTFTRGLR